MQNGGGTTEGDCGIGDDNDKSDDSVHISVMLHFTYTSTYNVNTHTKCRGKVN